jgi:hypothetical protein
MRRRDLLKSAVAAVPLAAALPAAASAQTPGRSPQDLLTYALNLKYLQAEFYRQGNGRALVNGREGDYLAQIGGHKQAHVAALTQAITAAGFPIAAAPAVDFAAAQGNREDYLETAYTVEDTVVRAYLGMPVGLSQVRVDLSGMFSTDARAVAVLGSVTGKPVVGGILFGETPQPLGPDGVMQVFQPYLTNPWSIAGSAAVTE